MDVLDNSEKGGRLEKPGAFAPLSVREPRETSWLRAQFQHLTATERKRQLGVFS